MKYIKKISEVQASMIDSEVQLSGQIKYSFESPKKEGADNYLKIRISDSTGNIYAYIYSANMNQALAKRIGEMKNDSSVEVVGVLRKVRTNGTTQNVIELSSISEIVIANGHTYNLDAIRDYLNKMFSKIKDPQLKGIVTRIFKEHKTYTEVPYSYNSFYFKGGLICYIDKMLKLYESIDLLDMKYDSDLVITALMIHRIGKVNKFEKDKSGNIKISLVGEIGSDNAETIGITFPVIDNSKMPYEDKCILKSIIGSTKGRLVWGATNDPVVPEAYLIHQLEQIILSDAEFDDAYLRSDTTPMIKGSHGRLIYKPRRKGV